MCFKKMEFLFPFPSTRRCSIKRLGRKRYFSKKRSAKIYKMRLPYYSPEKKRLKAKQSGVFFYTL